MYTPKRKSALSKIKREQKAESNRTVLKVTVLFIASVLVSWEVYLFA